MGDDLLHLASVAGSLPEERLRELAAAHPEETGNLGVELASCTLRLGNGLALTPGGHRSRHGDGARDPAGWRFGRVDHRRHARMVAGRRERFVFEG